jgi:hypothetical protein
MFELTGMNICGFVLVRADLWVVAASENAEE